MQIELSKLKENPKNIIYGNLNDEDFDELKKSISIKLQNPIIVNKNNIILSGHRRYKAAKELGWSKIEYIIKTFESEEDELFFFLTENKYRVKTTTELFEEGKIYKEIEEIKAKKRKLGTLKQNTDGATLHHRQNEEKTESNEEKGKASEKAAKQAGLKTRNFQKLEKIDENKKKIKDKKLIDFITFIADDKGKGGVEAALKLSTHSEDFIENVYNIYNTKPDKISTIIKNVESQIKIEKRKEEIKVNSFFNQYENEIILGSAPEKLKLLEDNSIDCVIIDPPYLIDYTPTRKTSNIDFNDAYTPENLQMLEDTFKELKRVLKPNGHLYSFFAISSILWFRPLIEKYFSIKPIPLIWVKNNHTNGPDVSKNYMMTYEPIFYYNGDASRLLNHPGEMNCSRDVLHFNIPTNKQHNCEKPIDLLEYLIKNSTIEGEVVLDCFSGSGSTLVAAKRNNRKYIGIEILEDNVRLSLDNLKNNN